MKKRLPSLLLLCMFLLGACAPKAAPGAGLPAAGEFTVTDALGREVKFSRAPQNIILAGKSVFMLADAIYAFPEGAQRIKAIADRSQSSMAFLPIIDPKFNDKPKLAGDAAAEQIAPLKPDLVILKSSTHEKLGKPIEALGIPVVYLDLETPEQYQRDLKTLGAILQNPARADELINVYNKHTGEISDKVKNVSADKKPKVLLLYYNDKDGAVAFNIPPASWIQTTLVKTAGGNPVWEKANTGSGWTQVNFEQIAAWDADQIYIIAYSADIDKAMATLKADVQWQALRAMKDGKVYGFPNDFYSIDQPDPRWYIGLSWLAAKINPDLYPNFKMEDEIIKFYKQVFNIEESVVREKVLTRMKGDWK
ncbi:MAG TPA: ABC transporter substrate-binding protein [Leptolinea sp.]